MMLHSMMQASGTRCVAPVGDWCGEGVLWHSDENAVYWSDINRFLVHRWDCGGAHVQTWFFDQPVTTVLRTCQAGWLLLVTGSGTTLWQPGTDTRKPGPFALPGWPTVRCNDAAADRQGNLWVGSMRNNVHPDGTPGDAGGAEGKLFCIGAQGGAREWQDKLAIANTLVWSPDGKTMYFGDSLHNVIWSFDFDADTSALANRRVFFADFERGFPDGSAIDTDGYVWNCRFGGKCIVRVAPDGRVDRVVEMPVSNATNCTFGGPDMRTLFITTAGLECEGERLAGSLFALETDSQGVPDAVVQVSVA